ncbi:putative beta-lysine N-acetyltransferase [Seleniivibrio woodruffii]|uniref:putative beta-lysine N-acetyltransferase n=1 Tax=Seleniivibrio woodruffii TaxID=1078050 RepID=UPI0024096D24|nr:putative beta-lysine N-acetyltransferase [Seleniivibrio woodruffii]
MTDVSEKINNAQVHHGVFSDRAYITFIYKGFTLDDLTGIEEMAETKGYSKIIAKVKHPLSEMFLDSRYRCEAFFPLKGGGSVSFMAKYIKPERIAVKNSQIIYDVLREAGRTEKHIPATDLEVRRLTPDDAYALSELYKIVFETYPFPIYNIDYLKDTMAQNIRYFGVFSSGRLIAAASAEADSSNTYAEMSDFATMEQYRRLGLARILNDRMEKSLLKDGIGCFYTIARSVSYGMNKTFSGCGYTFTGTLFNNTNIGGGIESMNIWYKHA